MACSSTVEKDYFFCPEDRKKTNEDRSSSCSDNDDQEGPGLKLRKGMFQKNVFTNKKKRKDESASKSTPLVPPVFNGGFRPVSLLERALFPVIKPDAVLPAPSPTEQSKTAQLTVFCAGVINVYDDVPEDRAQAIMLLASQSSSSPDRMVKDLITKADAVKSVPQLHSPSFCKAREDLPIARRHSLRRFLDKRRDRIISKYPYEISNDR